MNTDYIFLFQEFFGVVQTDITVIITVKFVQGQYIGPTILLISLLYVPFFCFIYCNIDIMVNLGWIIVAFYSNVNEQLNVL